MYINIKKQVVALRSITDHVAGEPAQEKGGDDV